jgi:hypothetical protein
MNIPKTPLGEVSSSDEDSTTASGPSSSDAFPSSTTTHSSSDDNTKNDNPAPPKRGKNSQGDKRKRGEDADTEPTKSKKAKGNRIVTAMKNREAAAGRAHSPVKESRAFQLSTAMLEETTTADIAEGENAESRIRYCIKVLCKVVFNVGEGGTTTDIPNVSYTTYV